MLSLVCLIAALICFALAAFWVPNPSPRPNLVALGLALLTLSMLLGPATHIG